jgi:electron transport complex protein RnfD
MSADSSTGQSEKSPVGEELARAISEQRRGLEVAPSPHLRDLTTTTRRMMIDVLIALIPVMVVAVCVFQWYAISLVGLCVVTCAVTEWILNQKLGRASSLADGTAVVTGVILALSLPWSSPWYVPVVGSVAAIALGKVVFGGLGCNIFNPAMVGRAFVMLSFARQMGTTAYMAADAQNMGLDAVSRATPLAIAKQLAADLAAGRITAGDLELRMEEAPDIWALLVGQVNGSLGETSAIAIAIGGAYLLARRVISWEIPASMILVCFLYIELVHFTSLTPFGPLHHLISGSLLLGAFFIATDPVTSPLTRKAKLMYGAGTGFLVLVIRLFSSYPEGVMFAVLVMNATVPLLDRWTIPRPMGAEASPTNA